MAKVITAKAWTLQHGDKIVEGIFGDCTVEFTTDDEISKGYSRIWYKRDSDFIHSFTTAHNNVFTIIPNEVI